MFHAVWFNLFQETKLVFFMIPKMNSQSFFFLQTNTYPIPRIMASEKTKLVTMVIVSLLSNGCWPLLNLNKNMESKVPNPTESRIMMSLL